MLYGPGDLNSLDWRQRIEALLGDIVANPGGGGSSVSDPRLDNLADIEASVGAIALKVNSLAGIEASVSAIELKLEEIRAAIEVAVPLPISQTQSQVHDAQIFWNNPQQFGGNPSRSKVRITNNIGDGNAYPQTNTGCLYLGYANPPDRLSFDQIILPGESVLIDWPQSSFWLSVDSVGDPPTGVFNITEFWT